jgi:hypothetical protein
MTRLLAIHCSPDRAEDCALAFFYSLLEFRGRSGAFDPGQRGLSAFLALMGLALILFVASALILHIRTCRLKASTSFRRDGRWALRCRSV